MTDTLVPAPAEQRSGLRRIAAISASLVGTYALTSVLGLAFWLLAARQLPVSAVGVGGAAVAMMTLLATLGTSGLGTLLIARLPAAEPGGRRLLTRTALAAAGTAGAALALVVPFVTIHLLGVGHLGAVAGRPDQALLLAAGTGLMSVAMVVDQAVLVIGNGALQLERNAVASAVKLVVLAGLTLAGQDGGTTILLAWTVGTLVSLPLVAWRTRGGRALEERRRLVDPALLRGLGGQALSHHALNTTLQAPLFVLPLLVLAVASSEQNGVFTSALQVAGVVFALPFAISIALFASAGGQEGDVLARMRFTVPAALGISLLANVVLFPLAPSLLAVFGEQYSAQGADVLRLLALAGLTFVVKDHYVALRRVQGRTLAATKVLVGLTLVELVAAYAGVRAGGIVGLTAAWFVVLVLEALVLAVPLLAAVRVRPAVEAEPKVADRPLGFFEPREQEEPDDQPEPEPRPSADRRARLTRWLGAGPALLLMSCGLLVMGAGVTMAREATGSDGLAQALYVAGLVVVFAPAAVGVLLPHVQDGTRVALAVAMAVLLQVSRLVLYPTRFMFHDELIHANLLRQIEGSGRLFAENTLLPVTSSYPGMELVTDAVHDLTGLGDYASAAVVLLAARVVLALAVLLVVRRVTHSTRIAATAVVLYACNPQMLFFNSQYSYQTLALPLAVLAVYLVLSRRVGASLGLVPGLLAVWAVVFTHHVTAVLLVALLAVWGVLELVLRRGRPRNQGGSVLTVTAYGALAVAVSLLAPGNTLVGYLGDIVTSSTDALTRLATGQQSRHVFQNSAGVATPAWEKYAILASLVLTLAVLVPALLRSRRLLPQRRGIVAVLLLIAALYPVIPGGHLTVSTAEVGDRSAGFVFVGVAFVVAWWVWRRPMRAWRSWLLGAGATVVFIGSIVLGAGSVSQQLPGPFRVSADARSIDADNLAAARWMATHLPTDSVVYADRVGGLLAAADGRQQTLTHVASGIDASRLLLDPAYGAEDRRLIREAGLRYLVVDRRDANGLPNQGVYIESGEFGGDDRTEPVPEAALRKFATVPGVQLVYDNGSVAVYDLEALDATR